jgi:hypothetical protein
MDESWRTGEARNQVRFRALNEEVVVSLDAGRSEGSIHQFVCECGDAACSEPIRLTSVEYEAVRAHGARFAIAVDHEDPEVEELVAEHRAFATVEKLPGPYARLAMAADPRR